MDIVLVRVEESWVREEMRDTSGVADYLRGWVGEGKDMEKR